MKVKLHQVAVLVSQLMFVVGEAQNNQLKFNLVEGPNGKPLGKINAISQDPHGYMWFSDQTNKCIYRYDGNRINTFRHDDTNPNSLGVITLEMVFADDAGMIWIGGDGLDKYNPATGIFKHYRNRQNDTGNLNGNYVYAILKDRQGRLWIGTNEGLNRLDEKTGKFSHYRNEAGNQKSLSSNVVWRIYEDRQGVIWVATGNPWFKKDPEDGGLNKLNSDGTFTRYVHNPKDLHSLINNKVAAMFEDSRGIFWVGTGGDGLHIMDRKTGKFERQLYDPNKPGKLSRPPIRRGTDNDKITFITEDVTGAIWIGTMYSGINRYDPGTKRVTHYEGSKGFPDSTSWNAFSSRDGELWLTTENANLYRVDPFYKSINSISAGDKASSFLEDKEGYLWVGTYINGLLKYDQHKNLIQQFKHDPSDSFSIPDNKVTSLFQNQKDTIWVGTGTGIRLLNTVTKQFSRFHDGGNLKDTAVLVSKILQDKQGFKWFSRWGLGLIRYNPKNNSFKHFLSGAKDSASISSNRVIGILEDRSGTIWTYGPDGINRLNKETGRLSHYLPGNWISSLYEDSEGGLWTGTENGFFRYNPNEDKFSVFLIHSKKSILSRLAALPKMMRKTYGSLQS